ncbi:hypothetical protein TNIN_310351 [Trichonephila inaurata madagascariensis]|uniref:Uncharacterized protein n=1 Tax=Trichonephila inaurata madagascariensis TaxID=2747483 RepID=A0A8X6YX87_9ARAC|nr:hypothetical protein TNIN_310351 [Trichonephila inaurata madagascariensis]
MCEVERQTDTEQTEQIHRGFVRSIFSRCLSIHPSTDSHMRSHTYTDPLLLGYLSGRRSSIPAVAKRFRRNVHSFRSATRFFKDINLRMLREHRIKTKKCCGNAWKSVTDNEMGFEIKRFGRFVTVHFFVVSIRIQWDTLYSKESCIENGYWRNSISFKSSESRYSI